MLQRVLSIFILLFVVNLQIALSQDASENQEGVSVVKGQVVDMLTQQPLFGVSIEVEGNIMGTISDFDGNFELTTDQEPPFNIKATIFGYVEESFTIEKTTTDNLKIELLEDVVFGTEVVVSASRFSENIMESPVTIEQMGIRDIQQAANPSFYESVANMKEVDAATVGVINRVYNSRGFNSPLNNRFVQRVDGMDNQAPGINVAPANLLGATELDIESVELIPGAASALYGANAFNGVLNMQTKDPFQYPGLSATVKTGFNLVEERDVEQVLNENGRLVGYNEVVDNNPFGFYNAAIRYAKAFDDKFAFKVNADYIRAQDFHANSSEDVAEEVAPQTSRGLLNPSRDLLNWYGDEVTNSTWTVPGSETFYPRLGQTTIARTGYFEDDLLDYTVDNLKLDGAFHYRINDKLEAIARGKYARGNTPLMSASRYSMKEFILQQYSAELKGEHWFVKGFVTNENTNESYDTRFLAINLGQYQLDQDGNAVRYTNDEWFQAYGQAFSNALDNEGLSEQEAHLRARQLADANRITVNDPAYDDLRDELIAISDPQFGARFLDRSSLWSGEGQYEIKEIKDIARVIVGGTYRIFELNSQGTLFPDTAGNDITMQEWGTYLQAQRKFLDDKLTIQASARVDKNENFDAQFSPRASAVYEIAKNQYIRGSVQRAFRLPSIQEQFVNLNVGAITLKGGIPELTRGQNLYGEGANAYTLESVNRFSDSVSTYVNANGSESVSQAVVIYDDVLEQAELEFVKPEGLTMFEVGYRGLFLEQKLMFDVNYYFGMYSNFLGTARVVQPATDLNTDPNTAPFDLLDENSLTAFQLYTNSTQEVNTQGIALGANYKIKDFILQGNFTWAQLITEDDDPVLPAFNTPEYKMNLSFGNRKIIDNLGFNLTWRWQSEFRWQGTFTPTERFNIVPAYQALDAQVNYRFEEIKTVLKVGGSNILDNKYIQVYGGPTIGAMYYISLTFDEFFNY